MRKRDIKMYAFPMAIMPLTSHLLQINSNMKIFLEMNEGWMDAESESAPHAHTYTH